MRHTTHARRQSACNGRRLYCLHPTMHPIPLGVELAYREVGRSGGSEPHEASRASRDQVMLR
jgi:hypothetical protein